MVAMVPVEVIQVEEVIRLEEEDTADVVMIRIGEGMGTGENEVDHPDRVKVKAKDGNHVEEMMDLLHLDDLDHEVQDEERGIDHHHHQGGDHLLQPLGVETTLHPQEDEMILGHDENHHHEGVEMKTLLRDGLGTILHQLERDETPPRLAVKQMMIHRPDVVGAIHHLVELVAVITRDRDQGRDQLRSLHLRDDDVAARAEAGVERVHPRLKSDDEGARPHPCLGRILPRMRWTKPTGMAGKLRSRR